MTKLSVEKELPREIIFYGDVAVIEGNLRRVALYVEGQTTPVYSLEDDLRFGQIDWMRPKDQLVDKAFGELVNKTRFGLWLAVDNSLYRKALTIVKEERASKTPLKSRTYLFLPKSDLTRQNLQFKLTQDRL